MSAVSYKTQKIVLKKDQSTLNITLELFSEQLDEVVVTAYNEGGMTKRSITGSIASISAKDVEGQQIVNIAQALEGKVAGVRVLTSSGQPGTIPAIYIRGISTLSSSASPLTVVDGAAFSINSSMLNPNDVETLTVLKDASAAVLYGSRAANGVVMYKTRRGTRNMEPRFSFMLNYGVQSRAVPQYELPNAGEYLSLLWDATRNQLLFDVYRSRGLERGYPVTKINGVERPDLSRLKAENEDEYNELYEYAGLLASQVLYSEEGPGVNYNPYATTKTRSEWEHRICISF